MRALAAGVLLWGWTAGVDLAAQPAGSARLETIPAFRSAILNNSRHITVYLPPGYDTGDRRYPVLYLQAGADHFSGGMRYNITATTEILAGRIAPLILVGIDADPRRSFDERFPSRAPTGNYGGQGEQYVRMVAEELKPLIDSRYRTLADAANTGIGGGSSGGQISFYAAITRPNVFGKMFAISAPLAYQNSEEVRRVQALPGKLAVKIYFDRGSAEGSGERRQHAADQVMRNALLAKGWVEGKDFQFVLFPGGKHDRASFQPRVAPILRFLFPPS